MHVYLIMPHGLDYLRSKKNFGPCFVPLIMIAIKSYVMFLVFWFAVSYSDIASDVIYFNLSPSDYTEPHSETWIWSRPSLPLPSGLVKNHFSDEQ